MASRAGNWNEARLGVGLDGMMAEECLLDGVLDSLEDIGYSGPLLEDGSLRSALEGGLASAQFVDLCLSLCSEIKSFNSMQETVTQPQGPEDEESFQLEMRSFLLELHCPHSSLVEGIQTTSTFSSRLLLVDFLLSELLAARLLSLRMETEESQPELERQEPHSIPANLTAILKVFGLTKPPAHITVKQLFDKIIGKTREVLSSAPKGHVGPGLVIQPLSQEQWATLDRINDALTKEYSVRRQMLLTRCDVTVQSFKWSERARGKGEEFAAVCQSHREHLSSSTPVGIARVLAARQELLCIEKTSSASVRKGTQCAVNKVLIGKVPDRGGRPQETRPPPEMPSFKRRTEAPQERREGGHGGGRGRGGSGRGGGRVQGGWSGGGGGGGGGWHQRGGRGYQHYGGGYHGNQQQQYYYS